MKEFLTVLFLSFIFQACSIFNYLLESPPPSKEKNLFNSIKVFTQQSLYNVDYNSLRLNPETFLNKKIRVFGVIIQEFEDAFLLFTNPFEDNEYGFYLITIDTPLPKQGDYSKPLKYLSRGSEVNVFGYYIGLRSIDPTEISTQDKSLNAHIDFRRLKNIPTIEASIIFDRNDVRLEYPVWISEKFLEKNYR